MRRAWTIGLASFIVTFGTWAILALGLGNAGLQQSIALGPLILVELYLPVLVGAFALAVLGGYGSARLIRLSIPEVLLLTTIVVLADLVLSLLVAPVLVGELTIADTPRTLATVAALGLQPGGVLVGGVLGYRSRSASASKG